MDNSVTVVDHEAVFDEQFVLPALPANLTQLLSALNSGEADAAEISEIVSTDAGLTAQILRIVNSAYYGLPTEIRRLRHAVAYLGLGEIKRIVVTVAVTDQLRPEDEKEFMRFWRHSFHTALTAKVLVTRFLDGVDSEEIYVSALLHDIGKLVYLKFFAESYGKLAQYCRKNLVPMSEAERELSQPSHARFGATLCDRWLLPDSVKQACLYHELQDLVVFNRDEEQRNDEQRVVCVANMVSNLTLSDLSDELKSNIHQEVRTALNLSDSEFLLLMGEVYELQSDLDRFLVDL